jgi:hypothetical protein
VKIIGVVIIVLVIIAVAAFYDFQKIPWRGGGTLDGTGATVMFETKMRNNSTALFVIYSFP